MALVANLVRATDGGAVSSDVQAQGTSAEIRSGQTDSWGSWRAILRYIAYASIIVLVIFAVHLFRRKGRSRLLPLWLIGVFTGMFGITFLLGIFASAIPVLEAFLINIRAIGAAEGIVMAYFMATYGYLTKPRGTEDWPVAIRKITLALFAFSTAFFLLLVFAILYFDIDPINVRAACDYSSTTFDIRLASDGVCPR